MNAIALGARRGWAVALIAAILVMSTLALARPAPTAAQDEELPKLTMWGWPTALLGFFDTEDDKLVNRIRDELGIELELIQVDQPEIGPKLKAALPAGQGPDLVATDFDVMAPYWTFMEPLDGYAAAVVRRYGTGETGWAGRQLARLPPRWAGGLVGAVLRAGPTRRHLVLGHVFGMREVAR